MKIMKYIILNFAYGFGPFLRTTELALAINDILEQKGLERLGVIIPWVYGEKQKRIMQEEFGSIIRKNPDQLVLDNNLGQMLGSIFYGDQGYEESLRYYLANIKKIENKIKDYFADGLMVQNFAGLPVQIKSSQIAFCISRAPRVNFPIEFSYNASFAFISEILDRAIAETDITLDKNLFKSVAPYYFEIEAKQTLNFIAEPGTFSYLKERLPRHKNEILTPPNAALLPKKIDCGQIKKGIYLTVTGIPTLERLFQEAKRMGVKIYSNNPKAISGSQNALPHILGCPNILFHFARSGWGSAWLSLLKKSPFVTPAYDQKDDPEIYFNNICLEKMGLGLVYKGQSISDLIAFGKQYRLNANNIIKNLLAKYGTLDGISYTAEKIVSHYLNGI